jgi:hypothetical protein
MEHQHADAFRLIRYRADNRHAEEAIWNSRDGLAYDTLILRDGSGATRLSWDPAPYLPDHRPAVGDRIFIDLTVDRAIELADLQAETWWNAGSALAAAIRQRFVRQDQLEVYLEIHLAYEAMCGAPELVEVTEQMALERGWLQSFDHRGGSPPER